MSTTALSSLPPLSFHSVWSSIPLHLTAALKASDRLLTQPFSLQIHSLCYNDCTFSFTRNTPTRTFNYNFSALAGTVSLAGAPSFTSKGLKYFHHFTLSLCGNQVGCAS